MNSGMGESGESLLNLLTDAKDSGDDGRSSNNIEKGNSISTSTSDTDSGEEDLHSMYVFMDSCSTCVNSGIGESGERALNAFGEPVDSGEDDLKLEINISVVGEKGLYSDSESGDRGLSSTSNTDDSGESGLSSVSGGKLIKGAYSRSDVTDSGDADLLSTNDGKCSTLAMN